MEANQQDQEEVEAQIEDAHGGQSPPQRFTRSMFKALGTRGHLFSLFAISLVKGAQRETLETSIVRASFRL